MNLINFNLKNKYNLCHINEYVLWNVQVFVIHQYYATCSQHVNIIVNGYILIDLQMIVNKVIEFKLYYNI